MATKKPTDESISLTLSYKNLAFALIALNILTLFLWQPWNNSGSAERTITVNGETVIESEPDEFLFSPNYQFSGDSKDEVLDEAVIKANEVVDGLKELGVDDKDIKLDTSAYETWWYQDEDGKDTATVTVQVTVNDREFAQEVQDYLVSTDPEGQISPWPTFSEEKQDELEKQARKEAVANAKVKAEEAAAELGASVGKVVNISEGSGFGDYFFGTPDIAIAEEAASSRSSLPVQPGENEYRYNVTVEFEIK